MKFKILIAEDEISFQEILVSITKMIFDKYFPSMELKISLASNGQEELQIVQNESQDIIITDINMPIMNGKEAVKKIRLFDKTVPILALTALTDTKDVQEIIQSGVSNYTAKPLNKKLFIAQIRAFVNFYIKSKFQYNKSAINLISKEIFKRKTIFSIDRIEDLFEFWEYILGIDAIARDNIQEILKDMYTLEEKIIKSGVFNEIVLEENATNIYVTLSDIDEKIVSEFLEQYNVNRDIVKYNTHFITFLIAKKELLEDKATEEEFGAEDTPEKSTIEKLKEDIEEARLLDLRYSTYETVSAVELGQELDPSMEDKIENFDEDIELIRSNIYIFEGAKDNELRDTLHSIISSFRAFDVIIENIGLFNVINRTFNNFTQFLENIEDDILNNLEKRILLATLLNGLVDDLEQWITHLFLEKDAPDIHYFDASFTENCLEIESLFLEEEDDEDDDDDSLEFF